jgi:hypothetical protein
MKRIATILLVTILATSILSCSKSDDDSTPENYTIEYTVISVHNVTMDTIKYINVDGEFVYVLGEANFNHSFKQPSNNYHAEMYLSGAIGDSGTCNYAVKVIQPDGSFADMEADLSDTPNHGFSWSQKFKHTSN